MPAARNPHVIMIRAIHCGALKRASIRLDGTSNKRVAGSLTHPHIVTVFDFGVHAAHPFVVLELL